MFSSNSSILHDNQDQEQDSCLTSSLTPKPVRLTPRNSGSSRCRDRTVKSQSPLSNTDLFTAVESDSEQQMSYRYQDGNGGQQELEEDEEKENSLCFSLKKVCSIRQIFGVEEDEEEAEVGNTSSIRSSSCHSSSNEYVHDSFCVPDDDDEEEEEDESSNQQEDNSYIESFTTHNTSCSVDDEEMDEEDVEEEEEHTVSEISSLHEDSLSDVHQQQQDEEDEDSNIIFKCSTPSRRVVIESEEEEEDEVVNESILQDDERIKQEVQEEEQFKLEIKQEVVDESVMHDAKHIKHEISEEKEEQALEIKQEVVDQDSFIGQKVFAPDSPSITKALLKSSTFKTPKTPNKRLFAFKTPTSSIRKITKKEMDLLFLESLDSKDTNFNPYADKQYFSKHRQALCSRLFRLFQRHVFENKLPDSLNIQWSNHLKTTAGYFQTRLLSIELHSHIELSSSICNSADRVRDVLLHECCHAAVRLIDGKVGEKHGSKWKRWCEKAFQVFPCIEPVSRCHHYHLEKAAKFQYICQGCGVQINKQRKWTTIDGKLCRTCGGHFQQKQHE